MTSRTQESPFRETEWDQRLDKMLDDLKTTVSPDSRPSSRARDNALVSSFRSSSRSDSRGSRGGIEDGGNMRHKHNEYLTPDNTRVVSDQYEYDSGDTRSNNFQKKVIQSTYSSYKVKGDLTSELDDLQKGPSQEDMERASKNTKVVSASQKVANKLVDALASIGADGDQVVSTQNDSASTTLETKGSSDCSTLTRLHRNITELDHLIEGMDAEEKEKFEFHKESVRSEYVVKDRKVVQTLDETKSTTQHSPKQISEDDSHRRETNEEDSLVKIVESEIETGGDRTQNTSDKEGQSPYTNEYFSSKCANNTSTLNGRPSDDDADDKGSEVRRIVWRNRFEKTCEAQDSTAPPAISIEEAAKVAQRARNQPDFSFNKTENTSGTIHNLNHVANSTSPGGPAWPDPIPIPTPPQQLSPGEPGVAYVYTYGSGNTNRIQHLPPLNYVSLPPASTMPTSDGAPSPTPSSASNQPIIYHYSYHYTIQPGQNLPEGVPRPSDGGAHPHPPALQMAPPQEPPKSTQYNVGNSSSNVQNTKTSTSFNRQVHSSSNTNTNDYRNQNVNSSTIDRNNQNVYTRLDVDDRTRGKSPTRLSFEGPPPPATRSPLPRDGTPSSPGGPNANSNISVTVNKTTTHTTHNKDYPGGTGFNGPVTSTPFPTPARGRSRSTSPEKAEFPRQPRSTSLYPVGHPLHSSHHHTTYTTSSIHRTNNYSDSLDRVKRPNSESLPFPDTSPIKGTIDTRIPRRVDDLMTSFDSEDGPGHDFGPDGRLPNGRPPPRETEPLVDKVKETKETELINLDISEENKKMQLSKNKAGAPVYYPPGHQQLFSDAMHTMTLKEGKRRGMAKWRMEKASGYKESSSSSESKGGMAMVPVCLPLCCGAACTIM